MQEVLDSDDSELSYIKLFMKTFMEMYNESFPLKKMTSKEIIKRKGKPWISKGIVKSLMYK